MLSAERVRSGVAHTRFGAIRVLAAVDSTNRVAREEAAAGVREGLVVVADHQTAGRGRLGRTWEAPAGTALLVSLLLRPELPPEDLHLVTAAVAVAARSACASVAGVAAAIKWPNDLLVEDRKLAGILAEAAGGAVVVGMGLNVSAHPEGAISLAAAATAAVDGAGSQPVDREDLLVDLLVRLDGLLGDWEAVADGYRRGCATIGRRVRVEQADRTILGQVQGVDDHGRLRVVPDDGDPVVVSVGDVVHLRLAWRSPPRSRWGTRRPGTGHRRPIASPP